MHKAGCVIAAGLPVQVVMNPLPAAMRIADDEVLRSRCGGDGATFGRASTMSLLGLMRHLAEVERATFRVLMAGQDAPRLFCSSADRDGDFGGAVPDPQVVDQA